MIIPILFYHGMVTPYPYPMCWLHAFSQPKLAEQLYGGNFPLIDVTDVRPRILGVPGLDNLAVSTALATTCQQ